MNVVENIVHAIVAVFRLPPATHLAESDAETIAQTRVDAARSRLLESTSTLRQTAQRVCDRIGGHVNGHTK